MLIETYVKCKNCYAHYLKGFSHKCDGLMKNLVKNYKKKKYWKIEKVTGKWEIDVALERCERVEFFKKSKKLNKK